MRLKELINFIVMKAKWQKVLIAVSILAVSAMMLYEGIMRVVNS